MLESGKMLSSYSILPTGLAWVASTMSLFTDRANEAQRHGYLPEVTR